MNRGEITSRSARHRPWLIIVVVCLASLSSLLFGELLLRFVFPQPPSWLDVYRRHPSLPFPALQPNITHTVDTGETLWTIYTDDHGFRVGKNHAFRKVDGPLVLVLGDSFTFGHGVNYADSFVGLLESKTKRRFVNAAVPGYGPVQYQQIFEYQLEKGLKIQKVLVVVFLGNDFQDCVWNKDAPVRDGVVGDPGGFKAMIKRNSHFYRLSARLYHRFVPRRATGSEALEWVHRPDAWEDSSLSEAYEKFRDAFAKMAADARQRQIDLQAALIPARMTVEALGGNPMQGGTYQYLDYDLPRQKAAEILMNLGIPFVDITPSLVDTGATETYFMYDGHFTELGNKIAAESISDLLLASGN